MELFVLLKLGGLLEPCDLPDKDSDGLSLLRFSFDLVLDLSVGSGSANLTAGGGFRSVTGRIYSEDLRLGFRPGRSDGAVRKSERNVVNSGCSGEKSSDGVDNVGGRVSEKEVDDRSDSKLRFDCDEVGLQEPLVLQ